MTDATVTDPTMTVEEIALYLRCKPHTVRRLIATGELEASKVADRWIAYRSAVDAFIKARSNATPRRKRAKRRTA